MHALILYNACMSNIQYTVRSIPEPVDEALRKMAKDWNVSLNEATIKALKIATGATDKRHAYHDLDHLFGAGIGDQEAFNEAMTWADSLPVETDPLSSK